MMLSKWGRKHFGFSANVKRLKHLHNENDVPTQICTFAGYSSYYLYSLHLPFSIGIPYLPSVQPLDIS